MSGTERSDQLPFSAWIRLPQTIVALSALLLSVCGLFISIYEASLIRRSQRASVWPHVAVAASLNLDSIRIWVQNTGVGPARIQAATVTYQGEAQAHWAAMLRSAGQDLAGMDTYQSQIDGRVLPADSPQEVIFRVTKESEASIEAFRQAILDHAVDVRVCYCSVYEECRISSLQDQIGRWLGTGAPNEPREVDSCDAAERSQI